MTSLPSDSRPLVLIVEDNAPMNEFLREILSQEYRTEIAFNGIDGLEKATHFRPDLVITDIMMPEMDGAEMFHALRSNLELASIPIIVLSATADNELRTKLLRDGAEDFIIKPFMVAEVLARVRNLLRIRMVAKENAQLYEEAKKAVRLREEILGIVSHDLRTPLSSIRLRNQLVAKMCDQSPNREKVEKQVAASERTISHMERMIGDLIHFAKIESGHLSLKKSKFEASLLIEDVVKLIKLQAEEKNVIVMNEIDSNLPPLSCDGDRILQVFSNLIGNAIKFSPKNGKVQIRARQQDSNIQFTVADQGEGIPKEDQERIFERFWQAEDTARLGTGLGLSIAKGIVSAHGGKIWVESTPGNGTTFYFTIPLDRSAQPGMTSTRKGDSEGRTLPLLTVDGNPPAPGL